MEYLDFGFEEVWAWGGTIPGAIETVLGEVYIPGSDLVL
jgi:hypothetical protein